MCAGAGRSADGADGCGRGKRVDQLAGERQLGRIALEQGQPQVLGRSVTMLERRLVVGTAARMAVVVMMMAMAVSVMLVMLGVVLGVLGVEPMRVLVRRILLAGLLVAVLELGRVHVPLASLVRGLGPALFFGFAVMNQGVEPRHDEQRLRDRNQAHPGSADPPAHHAALRDRRSHHPR